MSRLPALAALAAITAIASLLTLAAPQAAHAGEFAKRQLRYPRVKAAAARLVAVEASFRDAGAAWPPAGVYLRGFKSEGIVELWAAPARPPRAPKAAHKVATPAPAWVLVRSFEVCARSGELGPKRRMGDLQVPEGFYQVSVFNPRSAYHLSLGVSYPNAADRFHSGDDPPGNAIMVHGSCVTVGCLPLEDGPIEDLYLAAVMAHDAGQQTLPIHIFPCRLDDPTCQSALTQLAAARPELTAFWAGLRPGYDAFITTGAPPRVQARPDGTYLLVPPRPPRAPRSSP